MGIFYGDVVLESGMKSKYFWILIMKSLNINIEYIFLVNSASQQEGTHKIITVQECIFAQCYYRRKSTKTRKYL